MSMCRTDVNGLLRRYEKSGEMCAVDKINVWKGGNDRSGKCVEELMG